MAQTIARNGVAHRMERHECTDALTGDEYTLWTCPMCGRQEREEGGRTTILAHGNAPTPEDAVRFAEMAKTPQGRLELSAILRRYPLHDKWHTDQAGMLRLADELGVEGIGPPVRVSFDP